VSTGEWIVLWPFRPPWDLTAEILAQMHFASAANAEECGGGAEKKLQSFPWWPILNAAKTYFQQNP
jgi:hypothetical protein